MSVYLVEKISKRKYFKARSLQDETVLKDKYIIGFDSEADTTSDGRPMMFQFSLPNTSEEDTILTVVPEIQHGGLGVFLDFLDEHCKNGKLEYLVYVWNLTYELTQLFHDLPDSVKEESEFTLRGIKRTLGKEYTWIIHVLNFKRQIVTFTKTTSSRNTIKIQMYDGMGFYKTALNKAAVVLGLGAKYELDKLSRSTFTRKDLDDPEYRLYAKRDAFITRRIGEYIQEQHRIFNIKTTISAPHYAATVFKTHFLTRDVPLPDSDIEQAGLYSYHGGKNGFYLDGPTEFEGIHQYDITSAYPEAMRALPNIEESLWHKVREYIPGEHGMYQVTMEYNPCIYRGMQDHNGQWTQKGLVVDTWLTSYELEQILARHEGNLIKVRGYILQGPTGGPLEEYVDRFFQIKRHSSGAERETAKLLLNSLYGKFFQKQPLGRVGTYNLDERRWVLTDREADFDYEAGGLYNPPIASLITGFVRAKVHRLEHQYESVMTSTDGLFGYAAPIIEDLGKELGQLTVVTGKLRIWRERLYIFDGNDGKRKFALHGFHSGPSELESIPLARGEYRYEGQQMITLKMSTIEQRRHRYSPGQFVKQEYTLRI